MLKNKLSAHTVQTGRRKDHNKYEEFAEFQARKSQSDNL